MANQNQNFVKKYIWIYLAIFSFSFIGKGVSLYPISLVEVADVSSNSSITPSAKRDAHKTFEEEEDPIDLTNPMDLMNRLRRASAMSDATSPSDAIDEALKAFDGSDIETSSSENLIP